MWDLLTLRWLGGVGKYGYQMQKGWMEGGVVFVMDSMGWIFQGREKGD